MNNQLAALIADSGRAPSAPVPALHDQFQLASLLGDARSADLRGAHFVACDFSRADLRGADLQDARFDRCDLTGADFRGATTDGLTLIDCPADGADFRGAHWED